MNCQQARQAMLTDPQRLVPEVIAHVSGCEECRRYQSNVEQWDGRIVRELRRPVKENLTQRVMAAQRLRSARRRMIYAMAASVAVVALGLSLWLPQITLRDSHNELGRLMAEHMDEDPLENEQIDPDAKAQLASLMVKVGAKNRGSLPTVIQAQLCPVGKEMMVHAVFEVNGERVVAFIARGSHPQGRMQHGDWGGELQATPGGAIGVFAQHSAARQAVMQALMNGVEWAEA